MCKYVFYIEAFLSRRYSLSPLLSRSNCCGIVKLILYPVSRLYKRKITTGHRPRQLPCITPLRIKRGDDKTNSN